MNLETALVTPEEAAPVYFDRSGEAIAPAGCVEVENEAAWLRVALESAPLLIRGKTGEKAAAFYAGRGRVCLELQSPRVALEGLGVDSEGLEWLRTQWGEEFTARFAQLSQPLKPATLLAALFPEAKVSWSAPPSREGAARWLLWRAEGAPDALQELLNRQAALWQEISAPDVAPFYAPENADNARKLLRVWMGLDEAGRDFPAGAGVFPIEIPAAWRESARGQWMADLAGRRVGVWDELRARALLGDSLRREAATATAKYLGHHSGNITPELLNDLGQYLAPDVLAPLDDLVPPAVPVALALEADGGESLHWFHDSYWPFRRWQARLSEENENSNAAREATRAAARSFGVWYLGFYARALAGGLGMEFLAGSRARTLREADSCPNQAAPVTLLVIVDGLHEGDAASLLTRLKSLTTRLEVLERGRAFTAIPTITEIAKPALWWGLPPVQAAPLTAALGAFDAAADGPERAGTRAFSWPDSAAPGRELKEHADVRVLNEAGEGEIWVWNVLALDKAYHKNYPPATTTQEAAGILDLVADRIAAATEAVPEHLAFRVVITADHGRLPGPSPRTHPTPPGSKNHGRTALVDDVEAAPALAFTEQDCIWGSDGGGERVWLNPRRFGLSMPAVICADENAFAPSAGAHIEYFSHGGLWPEEIVVPWIALARDQGVPHIEATLSGKAKAGGIGNILLEARNGSEMNLILQEVRLIFSPRDERTLGVSQVLKGLSPLRHEMALQRWPDTVAAARAKAILVFSRPDGSRFEVAGQTRLESEELYRASNILEDFDS